MLDARTGRVLRAREGYPVEAGPVPMLAGANGRSGSGGPRFPRPAPGTSARMGRIPSARSIHDRLRRSLWFAPGLMTAVAIAMLVLLLRLDSTFQQVPEPLRFSGGPEVARDVASTIAGAIMGFIGVVFSITIVALQLASSQFSPRALRGFLRDRVTKATLGAFVATFAYALLTIRHVDGADVTVPNLTMTGLFALTFLCVVLFIVYIHHIAQSIRIGKILDTVLHETRHAIDRLLPGRDGRDAASASPFDADDPAAVVHLRGKGGVLVDVDRRVLLECAVASGGIIELVVAPGDFVRHGGPVARVHGVTEPPTGIDRAWSFANERSMHGEVGYGLRQLVDVALRALSPGLNDPTTAVQAIDRIHEVLGLLLDRDDPDPWLLDDEGMRRVWLPARGWEEHVSLALDEIRIAGAGQLQVHRRLLRLLEDLMTAAPEWRRRPLEVRRAALLRETASSFDAELDLRSAVVPDSRGLG